MSTEVSVVILNWNGHKYLDKCIKSVVNQAKKDIEIILVDNNSSDGSFEKAVEKYNIDICIQNEQNFGFAKGMNIGIQHASGEYIMLLNMDVYLDPFVIAKALQLFIKYPGAGVIMGKELLWENFILTNKETRSSGPGYLRTRGQGFFDKNKINSTTFCFGAMGSFPVFRKKVLKEIRSITGYYFDPKFETGWNDKDIFFCCHHLNWKFLYTSEIKAYHAVSGSVNNKSRLIDKDIKYQQRIFRNRYYFIFKNYPFLLLILHFPFLLFTELILYPYYLVKNPVSLIALCRAQKEFLNNINAIKKDRIAILKYSKLRFSELISFFKRF